MKKKQTPKKSSKKHSVKSTKKVTKKTTKKRGVGKVFLWLFLVFVILTAGGIFYVLNNINFIVKSAIEKYGSEAVQTDVRVKRVNISLKEGSAVIYGLTVANPNGYSIPHAFSLGEISADIDLKSVTEDVKTIEKIVIDAPEIYVEVNADNNMNLNDLKDNLSGNAPAKTDKSKTTAKKGDDSKLKIKTLRFAEAKIFVKIIPLHKEYTLKMPSFVMTNVGGRNGAAPDQIARQVLKTLTNRAITQVRKQSLNPAISKLKKEAGSKLKKEADSKAKGALKGLLGK